MKVNVPCAVSGGAVNDDALSGDAGTRCAMSRVPGRGGTGSGGARGNGAGSDGAGSGAHATSSLFGGPAHSADARKRAQDARALLNQEMQILRDSAGSMGALERDGEGRRHGLGFGVCGAFSEACPTGPGAPEAKEEETVRVIDDGLIVVGFAGPGHRAKTDTRARGSSRPPRGGFRGASAGGFPHRRD